MYAIPILSALTNISDSETNNLVAKTLLKLFPSGPIFFCMVTYLQQELDIMKELVKTAEELFWESIGLKH